MKNKNNENKLTKEELKLLNALAAKNGKTDNIKVSISLLAKLGIDNALRKAAEKLLIVNKAWQPKSDEKYYVIYADGDVGSSLWQGSYIDKNRYALGNCFGTRDEAEFEVEKQKVITELKRYAEQYNEFELNWNDFLQPKYYLYYHTIANSVSWTFDSVYKKHGQIYFTSAELCKRALAEIGEDRIRKYLFNM